MKRRSLIVGGAALVAGGVGFALAPASAPARPAMTQTGNRTAEVTKVILDWAQARVKGDAAFLERFYAPDLEIGQMQGGLVNRNDDIALFAAKQIKPEFIRDTDISVRLYGNTAVVTCIENLKGSYRGYPGQYSLLMLNVLVYRDHRWQLVGSQSTQVQGT